MRIKKLALPFAPAVAPASIAASQALNVAADTDSVAALQAQTAAVPLTLGTTSFVVPVSLTLTSAGNLSAGNFTIVGTSNEIGTPATEVLVGPNANTVTSVNQYKTITSITPNTTSATTVSAGNAAYNLATLVLTGINLVSTYGYPVEVTITSAADASTGVFKIVGTDRSGAPLSETISGPNASTVKSVGVYSTVTSIEVVTTVAQNVSAGVPARVVTPWVIVNTTGSYDKVPDATVTAVAKAGTPTLTIEISNADPNHKIAAGDVRNPYVGGVRVYGDNAFYDASANTATFSTLPDRVLVDQTAWLRVVNAALAGSAVVNIARPGF